MFTNVGSTDDVMDQLRKQQKPGVIHPSKQSKELANLESIAMTQVSMEKGLQMFGQ